VACSFFDLIVYKLKVSHKRKFYTNPGAREELCLDGEKNCVWMGRRIVWLFPEKENGLEREKESIPEAVFSPQKKHVVMVQSLGEGVP